ncbi:hypothetical protein HDU87_007117 [Geranomyces variabilis]|uniref:Calponin-homology (CH) domain-containing protein n=1 Tax=Geranomyces variabilis TaxID=109894 RepID=A0AAD5TED5_9FUNG|nr:hypothetical protein HDU87_007117 [Geranomyces variabilis]
MTGEVWALTVPCDARTAGRPNLFPSPALTASADRLRSLAASAESRNAHTAAVRRANAALDDVDVTERTLTGFADKVNKTVEDRIVRALKSSLRDAVGRADTVIKREWERVASVLVDDVRFVFESEDGADPAVDGEEAIGKVRTALDQIAIDSDFAGELDSFVSQFIDNRFRSLASNVYVAMLNITSVATERALETRLTRLSQNFDAAGTPTGQSLPPGPQQSSAPAPAPAPRPATSPSGPPPTMPLPTAPAASPRSPPSHPVQSPPPSAPAPVPRPQVDSAASRPSSEAIPPSARPVTKPRPKSLATSEMLAASPSNARPPPPAERSPIAKARVSTDGGPDSDTEMEQTPAPAPAPTPARGGGGVSADLNRMLAGPPGKYTRPPPPEEEEVYEEEAIPPRPPARIGVHNDEEDTEDRDLPPWEEVAPPRSHAEVHAEPHRPGPAREMSVDTSHAPAVASPSVATGHKDKEKEKDKHKDKGPKSPKGIRGMLSHLTKSRPKKAKKDSKAEEDEEDAAEAEHEVIPEPLVLDELPESFPPPPTGAPPRPAPRPVAHPSFQEEAGDAPNRSHAKEASSTSIQSKASHSRQASTADGPEDYAEDGESTAPAPVIPAKPRRQPTAAMSALASVMRGRQENDGGATADADAETSSVGSRNRTSMYSDAGNVTARPSSTYSDASHDLQHQQTLPLSQTSTPAPTPPRPARPTSIAFADQRRSHESEPQAQSATSPPSGSAEPPRRPPKPVPSPLSQSPTKRKSLVSAEEGSAAPQPGHAPSIPPKPAARKSVLLDDAPTGSGEHHPTVPVPRPRPTSMARPPSTATSERPASQFSMHSERRQSTLSTAPDSSSPSHAPETVEEASPPDEESPKPARRIPGVFSTNHGALGALAAAVNGRSAMNRSMSQEIVTEPEHTLDNDENAPSRVPMPPRPNQAQAPHEPEPHVEPVAASPPAPRRTGPPNSGSNPDLYNNGLNFKRNQASTSGDDAAIEKGAVEWLNKHLASQNVQIDNLFSSLGNGLNLIWSLEDATGESVGKYNKRAMLPVHRLDNLSVALNFCTKKGVGTSFCSPQDIMDGDKGKILTLMNYIMKAWPLS